MSFDIARSGIQAINEQLETVSNNIANAGTYGFKSSRANFASLVADGVPTGVMVGSHTQNMALNGSVLTTGRSMDAMISGRGFFVARDQSGQMNYTRVGIFSANKDGFLVDASGRMVQGYGPALGGALGVMGDVTVPTGQIPAVQSTKVTYVANLSDDWTVPTVTPLNPANSNSYNMVKQSVVYDELGAQRTVSQYFRKNATNGVDIYYSVDGGPVNAAPDKVLTFTAGKLAAATTPFNLPVPARNGAAAFNVAIDYTGTTQYAGESQTTTNRPDGYASGTFVGVELGTDGSVIAKYSNEQQQVVGTIALATFPDEGQLNQINDTSWAVSERSGLPLYERPGVGLAGKLNTGALEGSNVDVTSELVGLMTSQRNYQANSKVISTENAMMQSLMQAL